MPSAGTSGDWWPFHALIVSDAEHGGSSPRPIDSTVLHAVIRVVLASNFVAAGLPTPLLPALLRSSRWVLFISFGELGEEITRIDEYPAGSPSPALPHYLGKYSRLREIQTKLNLQSHQQRVPWLAATSDLETIADRLESTRLELKRALDSLEQSRMSENFASGFIKDQSALRADQQELVDDFRTSVLKVLAEEHPEALHNVVLRMLQDRQPTVRSPRVLDALVRLGEALQAESAEEEHRSGAGRRPAHERGTSPRRSRARKPRNAPNVEDGDKKA